MLAKSTDYELPLIDESFLLISNTPTTKFLLQAELRAIQAGLEYTEIKYSDGVTYNGYVKDGNREGVGILVLTNGQKQIGEWHLNNRLGIGKL